MIEYVFTEEERAIVEKEALRRQGYNEERSLVGRNGAPSRGQSAYINHLLGAAGEMAVASYLGLKEFLFEEYKPVRDSSDLPGDIDVKTARSHRYNLIVQLDSKPGKNYWLVTIENRRTLIHGWLPFEECAKDKYKRDPVGGRPAYFIPKSELYAPDLWYPKTKMPSG